MATNDGTVTITEGFDIPVAKLPEPKVAEDVNLDEIQAVDTDKAVAEQAALMVNRFKQEREQLQVACTELTLTLAARKREIDALHLERAELRNNLATAFAHCNELKQEASDLRAIFASFKAQLERFEIPLPVRKRAKARKDKS